jgi:hypothetical protein
MSQDDLARLLTQVQHLTRGSEQGPESERRIVRDELALSDGVRRFQVSQTYSPPTLKSAPAVAYKVSYNFQSRDEDVSNVSIELRDFSRSVSVTGADEAKVEAVAQLIGAGLRDHETLSGGPLFRLVAAFLVFLLSPLTYRLFHDWRGVAFGASTYALGFVVFFGTSRLFPGAAVYRGEPSFLVHFAPEISFAALILAAISLLIPVVRRPKRQPRTARPRSGAA